MCELLYETRLTSTIRTRGCALFKYHDKYELIGVDKNKPQKNHIITRKTDIHPQPEFVVLV